MKNIKQYILGNQKVLENSNDCELYNDNGLIIKCDGNIHAELQGDDEGEADIKPNTPLENYFHNVDWWQAEWCVTYENLEFYIDGECAFKIINAKLSRYISLNRKIWFSFEWDEEDIRLYGEYYADIYKKRKAILAGIENILWILSDDDDVPGVVKNQLDDVVDDLLDNIKSIENKF